MSRSLDDIMFSAQSKIERGLEEMLITSEDLKMLIDAIVKAEEHIQKMSHRINVKEMELKKQKDISSALMAEKMLDLPERV